MIHFWGNSLIVRNSLKNILWYENFEWKGAFHEWFPWINGYSLVYTFNDLIELERCYLVSLLDTTLNWVMKMQNAVLQRSPDINFRLESDVHLLWKFENKNHISAVAFSCYILTFAALLLSQSVHTSHIFTRDKACHLVQIHLQTLLPLYTLRKLGHGCIFLRKLKKVNLLCKFF